MDTVPGQKRKRSNAVQRAWRRYRKPLARSSFTISAIAFAIVAFTKFVKATNRIAPGSTVPDSLFEHSPFILALWHGQHMTVPAYIPKGRDLIALVSRSADAELNAAVLKRYGIDAVRGSGGRDRTKALEKGGIKALLALKKALADGKNVCVIADIPHGTPREAGDGIVMLARISGRPIMCAAMTTSRRKVLEKTWDKTTISLPFGTAGLALAEPIFVPADADEAAMEQYRSAVTDTLNQVTERAQSLADGRA